MLAAFIAGAVLGIVANSVPTARPKSVTVQLIRRCPQQRDCLRPSVVQRMKDETSKVWSLFDVRIDWVAPGDAMASAVDVTVFLEESAEPAPHRVSKRGDRPGSTPFARYTLRDRRGTSVGHTSKALRGIDTRCSPFPSLPENVRPVALACPRARLGSRDRPLPARDVSAHGARSHACAVLAVGAPRTRNPAALRSRSGRPCRSAFVSTCRGSHRRCLESLTCSLLPRMYGRLKEFEDMIPHTLLYHIDDCDVTGPPGRRRDRKTSRHAWLR